MNEHNVDSATIDIKYEDNDYDVVAKEMWNSFHGNVYLHDSQWVDYECENLQWTDTEYCLMFYIKCYLFHSQIIIWCFFN